jgi:branched-chain amino acid transport system permease protein
MRPCGVMDVNYRQSLAMLRTRSQWIGIGVLFTFLCVAGRVLPPEIVDVINMMFVTIVAAHGLNILTGYCGQISVGHAAFKGVGAYTTAMLVVRLGWNHWVALPVAALAAGGAGVGFGLPALRLRGFYLAMSTLAAQFILTTCFLFAMPGIVGGISGITVPFASIGGVSFRVSQNLYYLLMPTCVIMTVVARNIIRSRLGRAFVAVRDNEVAAEIMGINPFGYKLRAFFIGCLFAGVAGWMRVLYDGCVRPDIYPLMTSIWLLGTIIIGGLGTTIGPILGVILVRALNEMVLMLSPFIGSFFPIQIATQMGAGLGLVVMAVVVIAFLVFEPRGLAHLWEVLGARLRHWPFKYELA